MAVPSFAADYPDPGPPLPLKRLKHLRAGDLAEARVGWGNWCAAAGIQPTGMVVVLPSGDRLDVPSSGGGFPAPDCSSKTSRQSLVNVSNFVPIAP